MEETLHVYDEAVILRRVSFSSLSSVVCSQLHFNSRSFLCELYSE